MRKTLLAAGALLLAAAHPSRAQAGAWEIDPGHSGVSFKVRHLFSKVPGKFDKFSGVIQFDPKNPAAASVKVTIQTASINTDIAKRDEHLRSPGFFDAEKFPELSFVSTGVKVVDATHWQVAGNLTMKGVTKPVTLEVEYTGSGPANGGSVSGFSAKTKINRQDFGVSWNTVIEGTKMLGDEVEIEINIEADYVEPKPAASAPVSAPASAAKPAAKKK